MSLIALCLVLLLTITLITPVVEAMSIPPNRFSRSMLPSRPVPFLSTQTSGAAIETCTDGKKTLDSARLIGTTRIGQAAVSPDGTTAVFEVRDYDFTAKKFNEQLWRADLSMVESLSDVEIKNHAHLVQLTAGSAHGWTSASSPQFSPCGDFVAFLSNRPTGSSGSTDNKSSVWILPVNGPGEARLLAEFPLSVGDLGWTGGGIIVSASVYVDQEAVSPTAESTKKGTDPMTVTANRDKVLADADGALGGLNAVLYKKLPIREWDRWLDSKMAHPFYFPVEKSGSSYTCNTTMTGAGGTSGSHDLLRGVPTAVPSGAFGGSEDWSISNAGHVAVSARPPLSNDEAWKTNRHIYLLKDHLSSDANANDNKGVVEEDMDGLLGTCITADNPGFDTNPAFSPDGNRLAWLTMAGPSYEADAVGIQVYDVTTGVTTTLLQAEVDWNYSPNSLTWSKDGKRLFFGADVRSRQALCSINATTGAGGGITIHHSESSTSVHGECGTSKDGSTQFLTTVQSLTMPSELFLTTTPVTSNKEEDENAAILRQLTHFNTDRMADTALGRPGELIYKGGKDEDVQAWLIRPAGFSKEDEEAAAAGGTSGKKYPLAVIYHGGPQGSTGDDWHYRWNLQYYASMGFAVLAPNFHGSTGFGHQFCRDISGNWEIGGIDTIAGVRAALDQYSWLDPHRVVGLGASYGGFTSNWLNGNAPKNMFQALVCHCGTFDLRSSYYATEELFFMETEFGGPAYTDRSLQSDSPYQIHTPSKKIHEWETPTLVIHGAKDYRLVESEGISTFTALQRRNIPSELLYLPTENHHCLNPQNSMVWHETVMEWIQKWTNPDGVI